MDFARSGYDPLHDRVKQPLAGDGTTARACHLAVEPGAGLPAERAPPGPSPAAPPVAGVSFRGSSAAAMVRSRSPTYCASSASTAYAVDIRAYE